MMPNARKWSISPFPTFPVGNLMEKEFTGTIGFHSVISNRDDYKMLMVTDVKASDMIAYADALSREGFEVIPHADNASTILSYWVQSGKNRMYMYYTASTGEARFIQDQNDAVPLEEFEYCYEKQESDNTTLYLYGLKMHPDGIGAPNQKYPTLEEAPELYQTYPDMVDKAGRVENNYKNCGAMYVIKLADNSVMIIDGGEHRMMCVEQAVYLNHFLHKITGTPENKKVRISCWFLTHPDGDHFMGFIRFMNSFHSLYKVERVMFNVDIANHGPNDLTRFYGPEGLQKWYPDVIYHRPHTGEIFRLADIEIKVMSTLEDLVKSDTMAPQYHADGKPHLHDPNNTSVVLRLTIDGRTALITGDASGPASNIMLRNYEADGHAELKVDILQIAHHGWDYLAPFFSTVKPKISMYNQSSGGAQRGCTGRALRVYRAVEEATEGGADNIYFSGDETVGFEVRDGAFEVVFRERAVGFAWDGSDGGAEALWDIWSPFPSAYMPNILKS